MKKYLLSIAVLILNIAIFAQTNTWIQKADLGGIARNNAICFSIGEKGYIGAGYEQSTLTPLKDFWEYDPATNTWTKKADFPGDPRTDAVGFSIGNKGYVGGGGPGYYEPYYKDFWEYNPTTDTWTKKADLPGIARHMALGFSIGNKGYYGTGENPSYDFFKDFWEYDPVADSWTQKADYGGGQRTNVAFFTIEDKGYVGCGYYDGWKKDFWEYNPATDKWTRKADFGGSEREYAVGLSIADKGYIGTGYPERLKDFWEYNPATDKWTRKADVGGPARALAIGFSIGKKGYIGTGLDVSSDLKDFWEYTPEQTSCEAPTGLSVNNVTDSSARLIWNVNASVKGFCIVYRPIGTSEWTERRKNSGGNHIALSGLSPNTTYQWKMRSVCEESYSTWVAGPRFTTSSSFAATTLNVSPNPVTANLLTVYFNSKNTTNMQLTISSLQGQNYITQKLTTINGVLNKTIDVSVLPKGIYVLKILANKNELQQIKFVKAN